MAASPVSAGGAFDSHQQRSTSMKHIINRLCSGAVCTAVLAALIGAPLVAYLIFQVGTAHAQVAPTLTVTPSSGDGTVMPSATWSSTGFTGCTASGGWIGVKATSGTQLLPAITITTSYGLICSTSDGSMSFTWLAPTTRTDGTALINLAGFKLYMGTAPANYTRIVNVGSPGATSMVVSNVPAGTWYAVATAYDTDGLESAWSGQVSKAVTGTSMAAPTATVTVRSLPMPPTAVTTLATVFEFQTKGNKIRLAKVGSIALGAPCGMLLSNGYYSLEDPDQITFSGNYRGGPPIGVCC